MINKRWKKTLSIMLSAAMVFSMNNVSWAKTADNVADGGISRATAEKEPEVFPVPIKGEVVGHRQDSVVKKNDKKNLNLQAIGDVVDDANENNYSEDEEVSSSKSKKYEAEVGFAEDNTYYAIDNELDADNATHPFFFTVSMSALKEEYEGEWYGRNVYADVTINDKTLTLKRYVENLNKPVYFTVNDINNATDQYDWYERNLGVETGKSYKAEIKVYTDSPEYNDEDAAVGIIPIFYDGNQEVKFADDTEKTGEPYATTTMYVKARESSTTVDFAEQYDPDDCGVFAVNILGGISLGGKTVLELLDEDGNVVGKSRYAEADKKYIYDTQYGDELATTLGFTREVTQVYGTIYFYEYLEEGAYTLRATVNNQTYTVKDAVKAAVLEDPVVTGVVINTNYNSNGDYIYVNVNGVNLDPTKVVPYFSQSDNVKATITEEKPAAIVGINDGSSYIYKLRKTADMPAYELYDEDGALIYSDLTWYPLNVKKTDSSYDVKFEYAEDD
ncbi:MAG: hypothetical protein IJ815_04255, partial [Lachnospiraceae bacterium]|nr:hypothetical protein [Lachnospiraceae bacterium]